MANINSFYSGDTKTYKFTFGNGIDITNWKIILSFKEDSDDYKSIVEISNTAGDNALDDTDNGLMYVTLDSVSSIKLDPSTNYHYSFKRIIAGTNPLDTKTLLTGVVDILQNHSTAL